MRGVIVVAAVACAVAVVWLLMQPTHYAPVVPLSVLIIAAVMCTVGFLWIRRVTEPPDDGPSSWRSHR